MKKMIAAQRLPYGLNHVEQGETFDAHDHDVEMLEHTGIAKLARAKAKSGQYETKVMTASTRDLKPSPSLEPVLATPEDPSA